jgi:diacylglycerol O-acyltransferase / wax synthase
MAPELNQRLTPADARFLYAEKPSEAMNTGGCLVYDGHISGDEFVRMFDRRLDQLPRYRQRVVFPPFALAHPAWEDDPRFDLANHVEEVTLPAPADDLTLSAVGGEFLAGVLDRRHPLWKVVLLQGRPDGNTAMVWKLHHAMVDGVSGVDVTMVIHDLKPTGDERPPLPGVWTPRPLPDPITQMHEAVRDRLTAAAGRWTDALFRPLRPLEASARDRRIVSALVREGPTLMRPAPRTPFNGPLSSERDFGWVELPFADIRQIKGSLGGTVNDVVLTIISGGLGRYLRSRGYPTGGVALRTMCPVSLRRPEEHDSLGNLVSMVIAPLYVGIADPVERLAAERRAMEQLKAQDQARSFDDLAVLGDLIPPGLQARAGQLPVSATFLNTVTTNVPGPQVPLYLAGRKLVHWYPLGPLSATIGLFNAILTYNQVLTIGATIDPVQVPDVWKYMGYLREAFDELRAAAQQVAAPRQAQVGVPVAA